jgi:5-formyltetrahydrofolate cyclo-ligase
MVGPSLSFPQEAALDDKQLLRARMRKARREHVAALPDATRALLFLRPPAPIVRMLPAGGAVGLYHALAEEAPTLGYARWLHENGYTLALPWFADRTAPMRFRQWRDPWDAAELTPGPWGTLQPPADAPDLVPGLVFTPLVAFTRQGARIGQGGGHYDRWLADHPGTTAIGLGWDCQLIDDFATEPHDRMLHAVVTPTRIYEGAC